MDTNFKMENKYITMIKGDTLSIGIKCVDENNNPISDIRAVTMTCRDIETGKKIIFQKSIGDGVEKSTEDSDVYIIRVAPSDTETAETGKYVYDVEIRAGSDVFTIMKGNLQIDDDVTKAGVGGREYTYNIDAVVSVTVPEIADGSLTDAKFTDALKLKTIKDYVTPEMYGAIGDGVTDDTTALSNCFATGLDVQFGKGKTYIVSAGLTISAGQTLIGNGSKIKVSDHSDTLAYVLLVSQTHTTGETAFSAENSRVTHLNIDANGKAEQGLCVQNTTGKMFDTIRIYRATLIGLNPQYQSNIHSNCYMNIRVYGYGVTAKGISYATDCRFYNCVTVDCIVGFRAGSSTYSNCTSWISSSDYFNGSIGIDIKDGEPVINNYIADTLQYGIRFYWAESAIITNYKVIHNTSVIAVQDTQYAIYIDDSESSANLNYCRLKLTNALIRYSIKFCNKTFYQLPRCSFCNVTFMDTSTPNWIREGVPLTKISTEHELYYYANGNGLVTVLMKGVNDNLSKNTYLGNLPKGYRPPITILIPTTEGSYLQIGNDGAVYFIFSKPYGFPDSVSNIVCTASFLATN